MKNVKAICYVSECAWWRWFWWVLQDFFRFNELANLHVKNICFHDLYMSVHIASSKTDVYRRGNDVLIARTGKDTCPVYWTKLYLELAEISGKLNDFIFHSVSYFKSYSCHELCKINKFCLILGRMKFF